MALVLSRTHIAARKRSKIIIQSIISSYLERRGPALRNVLGSAPILLRKIYNTILNDVYWAKPRRENGKMINERKRPANQQRLLAVRTHRRKIKGGKKVSSFIHEANYYGATRPVWINSRTIDEKRENKTFSKFSSVFSAESLSLAKRISLGFQ